MSGMDVSVVIPTRNRSDLLQLALRSVLRQQNAALEAIVVDEASTDATSAVVAAFRDPRVRVIRHETPRGVASARNRGGSEARGEWLAFLDDDDLWAPDKLVRQLEAVQTSGCDWVYTGAVNITDGGRIVSGQAPLPPADIMATLPRYNAIPGGGSNVVVRRTTWLSVGTFDSRLKNTEDWELWIRLAKHGRPAWVCSPLVAYRVHSSNASLDIEEIVRGTRLIEALHHTEADWGRVHRWLAESCLRRGERLAAATLFARAAVGGQVRGVAADFGRAVGRRLPRGVRGGDVLTTDPWLAAAARWLQDLEREMARGGNEHAHE